MIQNGDYLVLNSRGFFLYNRVIVTIVYNTKYLIGIYKHTFQILHMFIRRILKMCVINCLILIFLIFSFLAMPRGGELSSFKVPGVGNLLHSCKKNTNPEGIAWGGW